MQQVKIGIRERRLKPRGTNASGKIKVRQLGLDSNKPSSFLDYAMVYGELCVMIYSMILKHQTKMFHIRL